MSQCDDKDKKARLPPPLIIDLDLDLMPKKANSFTSGIATLEESKYIINEREMMLKDTLSQDQVVNLSNKFRSL
ncbi:hypothetical protein JTB14_022746 [Gonioctena quinquepunctata]|nr:hypothetical protein JTB14_022746 [Gonioctena quinquepunctata]